MSLTETDLDEARTRIGVCFSGGGIRAATFALGVYQQLAEQGVMSRARYLSAVSGGCYIAAGLAISHALSPVELCKEGPRPWAHNSPEELRLRRNLTYLAPGSKGGIWLFANLLYGLVLNLTPLLLGAFLAGRLVGNVLHVTFPGIDRFSVRVAAFAVAAGIAAVLVLAIVPTVGSRRFLDKDRYRPRLGRRGERVVMWLVGAAATVLALGVLLPAVIELGGNIPLSEAWPACRAPCGSACATVRCSACSSCSCSSRRARSRCGFCGDGGLNTCVACSRASLGSASC
jgi:hypothetical protein